MHYNLLVANDKTAGGFDRVPLYSGAAKKLIQSNAKGALLVIQPKPADAGYAQSSERKAATARTIGWQAIQSLATTALVYGLTPRDYNTCQVYRRALENGQNPLAYDESGALIGKDQATQIANAGAPKARRTVHAPILRESTLAIADKPIASELGRIVLIELVGVQRASQIAETAKALRADHKLAQPLTIGDLHRALTTRHQDLAAMDPARRAITNALAKSAGPSRAAITDAHKFTAALTAAAGIELLTRETYTLRGQTVASPHYMGPDTRLIVTGALAERADAPLLITSAAGPRDLEAMTSPGLAIIGPETFGKPELIAPKINTAVAAAAAADVAVSTTSGAVGNLVINAAHELVQADSTLRPPPTPALPTSRAPSSTPWCAPARRRSSPPKSPSRASTARARKTSRARNTRAPRRTPRPARSSASTPCTSPPPPPKACSSRRLPRRTRRSSSPPSAGQDRNTDKFAGKPVAVLTTPPAHFVGPEARGAYDLTRPNGQTTLVVGHGGIGHPDPAVLFLDFSTGKQDRQPQNPNPGVSAARINVEEQLDRRADIANALEKRRDAARAQGEGAAAPTNKLAYLEPREREALMSNARLPHPVSGRESNDIAVDRQTRVASWINPAKPAFSGKRRRHLRHQRRQRQTAAHARPRTRRNDGARHRARHRRSPPSHSRRAQGDARA